MCMLDLHFNIQNMIYIPQYKTITIRGLYGIILKDHKTHKCLKNCISYILDHVKLIDLQRFLFTRILENQMSKCPFYVGK